MTMPNEIPHRITTTGVGRGPFVARCSCGWIGSELPTNASAENEADSHVVYMTSVCGE